MKNFLGLIICLALTYQFAIAQSYSGKLPSGKLKISELDHVTIEGYSGSEIQISLEVEAGMKEVGKDKNKDKHKEKKDERAVGLRELNAKGLVENTGLGLSVAEQDGATVIEKISRKAKHYRIKVPNSAQVIIEHSTNTGKGVFVENFSGDLSASLHYGFVKIKNVTGPTAINTIYGDIDAVYSIKGPTDDTRLHSVYGMVDITVPASMAANVKMKTPYGKMYTDLDIKVNGEQKSNSIQGTINGGGALVNLEATYANIYLRKI